MFFAHIPAGYLIGRVAVRGQPSVDAKWILLAGLVGGGFPDVDLLYLQWLDTTPQHHHTYWTHLPMAWLGCAVFAWMAFRKARPSIRLLTATFFLAWLSHLLLDSIAGDIWWLYPFIGQPYSLVLIEARHSPWWMNYPLHWTMALEACLVTAAIGLEVRAPRLLPRVRRPKLATMALALGLGLIALESVVPLPHLNQPVLGASSRDWNPESYWHPHWGASGVHKGIDIFSSRGTAVQAAQSGWVVYQGTLRSGGNVALVLTPRGWLHYYAHLDRVVASAGNWVNASETLGYVGNTGNAQGKPAHLHYSIFSPIPRLQNFRIGAQGWKRPFYRDPGYLLAAHVQ